MKNSLFDTEKIRPLFDKVSEKELIANFKKCLFPDALKNLRNLKALGKVLLFSSYGKYKDHSIVENNSISYKTSTFASASTFLIQYVAKLDQLNIIKGLTKEQIKQLLQYTKEDAAVQKYTSDATRFVSQNSFDKWISKEKFIYTLTDNEQNLLGIIWFSKKEFEKYPFTFAIRLYK